MKAHVSVSSPVHLTPRVRQMSGLFDVPLEDKLTLTWDHDLPVESRPWNVGLIFGPSGAGKTLLAQQLWPGQVAATYTWPPDDAVIDGFPEDMGVRDITSLLSSVGFGSPPAWMRPYRTLSNGEQFRATVARALGETNGLIVLDEFTSVVDRQVAKIASHTVQKTVRKAGRQLVAVTCHYDVEDWLQPDWAYDVSARDFAWRQVQHHPPLKLEVHACDRSIWPVFARHHYLSASLHTTAKCFAAYCDGRPVAFTSYRHFPHPQVRDIMMAHRVVVLPDWQGLGIAKHLCEWQGQYLAGKGYRYRFVTAHPGLVHYFVASPRWRSITRQRQLGTGKRVGPRRGGMKARALDPRSLGTRSFEYVPVLTGQQ